MKADSKLLMFLAGRLLANTPANFLSLALLSASVGLRLSIPKITVLSKKDMARDTGPSA